MENLLSDTEFRIVGSFRKFRLFQFKNNYLGKNILKDPIFKKWFKEEESKNKLKLRIDQNVNLLLFCDRCQTYIYDNYYNWLNMIKCCSSPRQSRVCLYCGQIFCSESYCCLRNSILYSFREYLIDGRYFCSWCGKDCIKSVPIIFRFLFAKTFMKAFFFRRKIENNKYETYGSKETLLFQTIINISFLLEIVYVFIFYFPLTIAYIIYLYFYFQISLNQ